MYERSEDLIFVIRADDGIARDSFNFYGPFSAGLELATKRAALYSATDITAMSVL